MSIEFKVKDYCQDCDEFEPCVSKDRYTIEEFFLSDCVTKTDTVITCKHDTRCRSIISYLREQLKKEKETNDGKK